MFLSKLDLYAYVLGGMESLLVENQVLRSFSHKIHQRLFSKTLPWSICSDCRYQHCKLLPDHAENLTKQFRIGKCNNIHDVTKKNNGNAIFTKKRQCIVRRKSDLSYHQS